MRTVFGIIMLALVVALLSGSSAAQAAESPNILFVMTDDMPERLLPTMPVVSKSVAGRGATFSNAYVTQSLCCPSRASILRGQYPHNHGVLSNEGEFGGEDRFRSLGRDQDTFATSLHTAGYYIGFVGKYMNGYSGEYIPPGWDRWWARINLERGHALNENGTITRIEANHMTDIYRDRAMRFLRWATDESSDPPFMLAVWTNAPHLPAPYAERHANLFKDATLPKVPSFNEKDVSDKPRWVRELPRITDRRRSAMQEGYRNQLRSLRAVDEMVGAFLGLLRQRGELDNTYVVFTTDNGVHLGEHRYYRDRGAKSTAYEEAAGVPLVVRGPGIPSSVRREQLVANNDLAPTFVDWGTAAPLDFADGRSLAPLLSSTPPANWRTALLNERHPGSTDEPVPDYDAVITQTHTYVEYETGEKELYDHGGDLYQLRSLHNSPDPEHGALMEQLHARLDALKVCAGDTCRAAEGP